MNNLNELIKLIDEKRMARNVANIANQIIHLLLIWKITLMKQALLIIF